MILKAANEFDLDLTQCVLIGEKESDLQAGKNTGIMESNLHFLKIKTVLNTIINNLAVNNICF